MQKENSSHKLSKVKRRKLNGILKRVHDSSNICSSFAFFMNLCYFNLWTYVIMNVIDEKFFMFVIYVQKKNAM